MTDPDNYVTNRIQIQKDNMNVGIISLSPAFSKSTEQETRQKISVQLCQVFQKYV